MSKINNCFKETEIGVIPEDWQIDSIDNTSALHARIGWQGLTTREYLNTGKYMLIGGVNFNNGKVDWESCFYVDATRYNQDKNIQIRPYDLLVTKDGTIGKVAYIGKDYRKATLNSGVFVLRPLNNVYYPLYMYYIFMSKYFKQFLEKLSAGSTIVHLYQKDFIHFKFPLPPYEEQQKIASALSDMDEMIESLEKIIDKKKKIKQGTMQQLLTGKKRLHGFTSEWRKKKLSKICEIKRGASPRPINRYLTTKEDGINWIRIGDVSNSSTINQTSQKIIPDARAMSVFVRKGDLLLSNSMSFGKPYLLNIDGCIHDGWLSLSEDNSVVDKKYLFYYLSTEKAKKFFEHMSAGSGVRNLNINIVSKLIIHLPELKEQKAIASILSDMDAEIELLEKKLKKYEKIKEGMMQQLLTGRVRLV